MRTSIAYVSPEFRLKEHSFYPEMNNPPFEEYFYNNYNAESDVTERYYLPVFWTSFLRNHNYGQDKNAIARLQQFIDALDKSRKYYGICQYDNGPVVDLSGIDIKIFSMAGQPMDYTLPLICQPGKWTYPNERRDIFLSFVGRVTHPLRQQMLQSCSKVRNDFKEYYISIYPHPQSEYFRILSKSVFSMCCRGYSFNSFRIQESIQYGAIPVVLTDEWHSPHGIDFNDFGVLIDSEDILRIDKILNSFSEEEIKEKQGKLPEVFEKYFTFESNRKLIIKALNDGLV